MCGIFGYVGKKNNAAQMVLSGLKLLEYRGYDSWGIAVKNAKTIATEKHVGKIGDAETVLPESTLGIGHTRWATHGGVTQENAHPHLDCKKELAIIHNGIIENYAQIKEELLKKGHVFLSETDTEVAPHLIEEYIKEGNGFASSFRKAFNRLSGLNAIVAAYAPSKEVMAAKTGSPLVVGRAEDGLYLASDAAGIIEHTRDLLFMKDGEMVILGDEIQLVSLSDGSKKDAHFESVDWKIEESDKGQYEYFMLKEMHEQPNIVRNIATTYEDQIKEVAKLISEAFGTYFIGAGTAYNACLAGTYMFSKIAKRHVNTAPASEFNYLEDFLTDRSLIIPFSQSGETIDVIEPLNRAKEKGSKIAAVVNSLGSSIYRMADEKVLLGAGPEKAVASTKAYTAKLSILLLLSYALVDNFKKGQEMLLHAAAEMEKVLQEESLQKLDEIVDALDNAEHMYTVGRGVSFPTALEAALKIKEVSYVHTEGLAGGELKHGPIALITKGTPCIVFAPEDETYDAMVSNAMEIKARGGIIIGVGPDRETVYDHFIEIADSQDASPVSQIVPIQYLAYKMALKRNLDPDKPRNLAKSVTVK